MSNASRGPETAAVILPTSTTFGFPITGAASSAVPRSPSLSLTIAEASADTVEVSTTILGEALPEMSPPGPVRAETRSAGVPTAVKTMSQPASSWQEPAALAPSWTSGAALAAVRL